MVPRSSVQFAGRGAAEQARKHAERAAQLRRELQQEERRQRAWEAGAEGERLVAADLAVLEADGWTVLHDVRWPGRQRANLDHVAIGPGGVVVVDSKNWTGAVTFRDDEVRVGSRSMAKEITGVAAATAAVTTHVPARHRRDVLGVLCLVQQPVTPHEVGAITVVGRSAVAGLLRALPSVLTAGDVARIAGTLAAELAEPATGEALTTADVPAPRSAPRRPVPQRQVRRAPRRTARRRSPLRALLRAVLAVVAVLVALALVQSLGESITGQLQQLPAGTQQPAAGP
ncbi:NERD domain-containing protein [Kineococcus sp. TRM81007]|uniref:nuclease-related domain-containing protein n=1 Tax=Kineococcus sp. TRM81007 TaxID=2925831 RepID=UPI001F5A398D|nr:nuclease-related domain-containing protein [Kineococcus sp. TRM81007]MCI2237044.1 NERD domain-containing protein [Kineococcus sp. TRM81007]